MFFLNKKHVEEIDGIFNALMRNYTMAYHP